MPRRNIFPKKLVRKDIEKGRFEKINIRDVTKSIKNHGINILGNSIVGVSLLYK